MTMVTIAYNESAIDLIDRINRDVQLVLTDEAERIARDSLSQSVETEHIQQALQRVIRMLESHIGETPHCSPKGIVPVTNNRLENEFVIHDISANRCYNSDREVTLV